MKVIVLAEDTFIDDVFRTKGEVVIVPDEFKENIKFVILRRVEAKNKKDRERKKDRLKKDRQDKPDKPNKPEKEDAKQNTNNSKG